MKFLVFLALTVVFISLIPITNAQMSRGDEDVTLLGVPRVINNVGQQYDENGKGFDIEYVLEGILKSNVDIKPEENSVTFFYDSQGIEEDVLMIMLPDSLIENPRMVLIDGIQEREAIRNVQGNISIFYFPLYQENQEITFVGTKVIPEFGSIATLILVVSIISIIILTSTKKFPILSLR